MPKRFVIVETCKPAVVLTGNSRVQADLLGKFTTGLFFYYIFYQGFKKACLMMNNLFSNTNICVICQQHQPANMLVWLVTQPTHAASVPVLCAYSAVVVFYIHAHSFFFLLMLSLAGGGCYLHNKGLCGWLSSLECLIQNAE